ncbi:hypothetical protein F5146DRAFT_1139652 [Armillaria mellea]|nr:hypothetical protein F5146DRAFT_1139652 [Armillaria mellea]
MSVPAAKTLIQIFEYLDSNNNLLHVMQTCKVFHDIGIAQLYRHIHYDSCHEFRAHDALCSNRRDTMHRAVVVFRSTCGLGFYPSHLSTRSASNSVASQLVIDECTFYDEPLDLGKGYGIFPRLPITDLSLLGHITVHSSTQSSGSDPYPLHHFLTITSLRTLAISVVKNVDRVLAGHAPHKFNLSSLCKPKALRLCLRMSFLRMATQEELATFLNEVPLCPGAGSDPILPDDFLIPLKDAGSSLKRLEISDSPMLLVYALGLLERVAARWPNLESLDITIKEWDAEILYALSQLFRDFREDQV